MFKIFSEKDSCCYRKQQSPMCFCQQRTFVVTLHELRIMASITKRLLCKVSRGTSHQSNQTERNSQRCFTSSQVHQIWLIVLTKRHHLTAWSRLVRCSLLEIFNRTEVLCRILCRSTMNSAQEDEEFSAWDIHICELYQSCDVASVRCSRMFCAQLVHSDSSLEWLMLVPDGTTVNVLRYSTEHPGVQDWSNM